MKKNSEIKQSQLVPLEIRKEVYAEALELIQSGDWEKVIDDEPCLCIFLPCLLWGIDILSKSLIRQTGLRFYDTELMFPELKPYLKNNSEFNNEIRIKFLKSVI